MTRRPTPDFRRPLITLFAFGFWIASAVPAFAAANVSASGPATVSAGQSFQVTVSASGMRDVDTVRLNGTYSPDVLEWLGAVPAGAFQNISPGTFVDPVKGAFSFGAFSLSSTANGTEHLTTLTFRAKNPGVGFIQFDSSSHVISNGVEELGGLGRYTVTVAPTTRPGGLAGQSVITITSPTHPSEDAWYANNEVFVKWAIDGTTPIAMFVGFDQDPMGKAATHAVNQNAAFSASRDGVWYVHLQAVFSDGTIQRVDFRVQIDRTPPLPISPVVEQTNVPGKVPNMAWFGTLDETSGIDHYEVYIDGRYATSTERQFYPLTDQLSGDHILVVKAVDRAGNSSEGKTTYRITPGGEAGTVPPSELIWIPFAFAFAFLFLLAFLAWTLYSIGKRKKKSKR